MYEIGGAGRSDHQTFRTTYPVGCIISKYWELDTELFIRFSLPLSLVYFPFFFFFISRLIIHDVFTTAVLSISLNTFTHSPEWFFSLPSVVSDWRRTWRVPSRETENRMAVQCHKLWQVEIPWSSRRFFHPIGSQRLVIVRRLSVKPFTKVNWVIFGCHIHELLHWLSIISPDFVAVCGARRTNSLGFEVNYEYIIRGY